MSAEQVSESRPPAAQGDDGFDFPSLADMAASHERAMARVKYTDEMLTEDTPFAIGFAGTLLRHESELSADEIAALLHDFLVHLELIMDKIDDESLSNRNERMKVHISRLTSARGQTDQKRYAERKQADPVLRRIEAHQPHVHGLPNYRTVAISQLIDLRACIDWGDAELSSWFERTYRRLVRDPPDKTSTT